MEKVQIKKKWAITNCCEKRCVKLEWEAYLKPLLIAKGMQDMKMGQSEEKKQTAYLQNRMFIFFLLFIIYTFIFLCEYWAGL